MRSRFEYRVGTHYRSGADIGMAADGLFHDAARADGAVDEPRVRPDLGPFTDHGVALEQRAREQRDVRGELYRRVDVRALRIEHRHTEIEPAVVGPPAQHCFRSCELPAIIDALRLVDIV